MKTDDSPQKIAERIMAGAHIDSATACTLARSADQQSLWAAADELRRYFMGNRFHLCSIINARSGNCTENCRFCAQSA
ncbi:biotin synthase BioB, partial [Desulfobulbus sp. US2]|nr:biotin synthase BioB [Desulfobulbus sp. US2]